MSVFVGNRILEQTALFCMKLLQSYSQFEYIMRIELKVVKCCLTCRFDQIPRFLLSQARVLFLLKMPYS